MSPDKSLILVLNSGSSSLKFAVQDVAKRTPLLSGLAERLGGTEPVVTFKDDQGKRTQALAASDHGTALDAVLAELAARAGSMNWLRSAIASCTAASGSPERC